MNLSRNIADFFDRKTTTFLAAVSGGFAFIVIAGLCWYGLRFEPSVWFDEKRLTPEREKIKQQEKPPQLIETYRREDVQRREAHFKAQRKIGTGAYLLFGSLFVFVLSMRRLAALTAAAPAPRREERDEQRQRTRAIVSVLAVSVPVVAATFLGVSWARREKAPLKETPPGIVFVVEEGPKAETVPDHLKWPAFRGAMGQGIAPEMEFPLSWDAATGENILWKTEVPLPGYSSPIVWGDRVFLTGAELEAREVYCFDRLTGQLMWTCKIRSQAVLGEDFEPYEDTGLAAPTPVSDGRMVFAFFGTGELAAVDFNGKQVWCAWFGPPDSAYGLATSPILHGGKLILQLDQGHKGKGKSFLYAMDPATGKIVWKTPRDVPASWSSPIAIRTPEGEELITCADPFVISYHPATGKELWRAKALSGDVAPLPVYADGMVYAVNTGAQLAAIRIGGSGDVTQTHMAWTFDEALPDVSSPITDGKFLVMAAGDYGAITCLDAKTGKQLWQQDFDNLFWSSPILVGRRVYITDWKGKTYIFELSEAYKALGRGDVGERVVATPAFADSKIYIRGKEHLYCVGAKKE